MGDSGEDPRVPAGSRHYRRALVALFCAGIATFTIVYSPQALLPDIARQYEISESTASLAVGATTIGLAIGMIPWGRLSDRLGRVAAMRWAMVLSIVCALLAPLMPSFETFIGIRLVEGIMLAGLSSIGVTALAETVTPLALGSAVGVFIGGNTIGGLAGRILAATFGERFGLQGGLIAIAVVAFVAMIAFLILMPPTVLPPAPPLPLFRATLANLRNAGVMVMVLQAFLLMGSYVAAYNYLAFRMMDEPFGLSLTQSSWLYLAYIAGALASSNAWRLSARLTPVGVVILGCSTMLVGLGIMLLPHLIAVIVGLLLFTMGFFASHSTALTLASKRSDPNARSLAPSIYNLAYFSGSSVLGYYGGMAFAAAGWEGTSAMIAAAVALAGAAAWIHSARHGGPRRVDAPSTE